MKQILFCSCFISLLLFPGTGSAQFATLEHQSYLEKIRWVDSFYFALVSEDDSAKIFTASRQLKQYAVNANDEVLELEAELFEAYYYRKKIPGQDDAILKRLMATAEKGRHEKKIYITARAINAIAMIYWFRYQNYELGFAYFQELEKLLTTVTPQQFPFMANCYYDIGRAFYIFKDYNKALFYLKKGSAVPETPLNGRIHCATDNMIGLSYQQLNKLDSSDFYFNKALNAKYLSEEKIYYSIIQGNRGHNFYLRKEYDKAIFLLRLDMTRAIIEGRKGLAVGSATTLANIYLEQGRLEKVKPLTDSIFLLIRASKQWERLKYLYPLVSRYYAAIGDLQRSKSYLDSALSFNDSMSRKFNALQLTREQQKTDRIRVQAQQIGFQESKLNFRLRLFFITTTALLIALSFFIYYRQRKKSKSQQQLQEVQLQEFKKELEKAEEQLNEFVNRLTEQNRLVEQMETSVPYIDGTLEGLKQSVILTEEDWQKFRYSFNKVHVGFIDRLKQRHPQISPAEIRIVVLARLHFSTREMATALGISPNSIHVTWHRLRKKLDLAPDISLENLATEI